MADNKTLAAVALEDPQLRREIIEKAAETVVAQWRPPKDDDGARSRFDDDLERRVEEMFDELVREQIQEPVSQAIVHAMMGEFAPTDQYGSKRHGVSKVTLRELIMQRVEEQIKLPDNRPGYGHSSKNTALGEWLHREVGQVVTEQLKADYERIAREIAKTATDAMQKQLATVIRRQGL